MNEPIFITRERDFLTHSSERPIDDIDFLERRTSVGTHGICQGCIDIHHATFNANALHCRKCGLRVLIPVEAKTYHALRLHFTRLQIYEMQGWAQLPNPGVKLVCTRPMWIYEKGMLCTVIEHKREPHHAIDANEPGTWVVFTDERVTRAAGKGPQWLRHGEIGPFGAFGLAPDLKEVMPKILESTKDHPYRREIHGETMQRAWENHDRVRAQPTPHLNKVFYRTPDGIVYQRGAMDNLEIVDTNSGQRVVIQRADVSDALKAVDHEFFPAGGG